MLCKMKGFELFSLYLSSAFYFYIFLVRKCWCCHCLTLFSSLQRKKELKKIMIIKSPSSLYTPPLTTTSFQLFFFSSRMSFSELVSTLYDMTLDRWWWLNTFYLHLFFLLSRLHWFFPPNMWNIIQYMFSHLISKKSPIWNSSG